MKTSLIQSEKELKQAICELEETVLAKALEWAAETYRNLLEQIDSLISKFRPKTLVIVHKRDVWYRTGLGNIRVTRRQYRDQEGKYRYLLDELLNMAKYSHITTKVREIALDLVNSTTFRRSAEIIRKTTAIDISAPTIHRILKRAADTYLEDADKETRWFQETGELRQVEGKKIEHLMIEADGVMLSLQREKARKAEVKLGISCEGWSKVGKDRYRTVNKTIFADIADSDKFWSGMALKLHGKYDLSGIKQVIVGGDAATWIKEGVDYFGGRYQLCRYHLNRELCYALGQERETLKSVRHNLRRGEVDGALALLKKAATGAKADKALNIRKVIRYIRFNACGLTDYRQYTDTNDENLRRTGAIEGNVDKLVVRRMKNMGMSWSPQGIRRMLWLKTHTLEGTLGDCLRTVHSENTLTITPDKRVNRVIDRTLKYNYAQYFSAGLPALKGPHASRPWVEMLKSLTRLAS